jgi:hypothetical protein
VATRFALILSSLILAGCLGSEEGFRPGYEPRPQPETLESAEARALRMAVPVEIEREDTYMTYSKKEIGRVMGSVPRNPWNRYEWDLEDTLRPLIKNGGPDMGVEKVLGRRPVPHPLTPEEKAELLAKQKAEEAEGDDDDDDDDSGDDDDDDDEE